LTEIFQNFFRPGLWLQENTALPQEIAPRNPNFIVNQALGARVALPKAAVPM
jgi:hypothetical protein